MLCAGLLEKVVLCVEEKATGQRLEQFVWEIYFDMAASPGFPAGQCSRVQTEPKNQEALEDALRQVEFHAVQDTKRRVTNLAFAEKGHEFSINLAFEGH
jgi:hypothetical protein